ncbi:MAG TPA: Ig-like domain repeat protein [Candidatus Dormibacteraeota bacterium]|nr:Ig-like domain repeat protein [Candidatus Dormibacteraeota bacterium]
MPYDFAAIYNVLPLWNGTPAIDGTGQTIAIANESNINVQDVRNFRTSFGLSANDPVVVLNGPDPGLVHGLETEADLDVEWSGGVAKGATIKLVVSQSTETSAGVDLSAEYVIDNNLAPILSESFGECELNLGTTGNQFYNNLWEQAAAQGISVFISTGDNGSAGCDFNSGQAPQPAHNGLQVSGLASTPYNIAVGGTDFNDFFNPLTYWNTINDPTTQQSAKGYIPETTWNDSCTNAILGDPRIGFSTNAETNCNNSRLTGFVDTIGGSGGKSSCTTPSGQTPASCAGGYAKPSWQIGAGVPLDGKRDIPDVSLFASNGFVGNSYAICESDVAFGPCTANFLGIGGTSASAPAFAGIMALVNQKTQSRQGNANVVLYKLATKQTPSTCNSSTGPASTCIFNDVTSGTIAMPCAKGSPNCTTSNSNDQYGIFSGFDAGAGYDLATGLGSVNVQNLVNNWSSVTFLPSSTTLSASVNGTAVSSISAAHGTPVAVNSNVSAGSGTTGTPTGQVALMAAPNPTAGNPSSSLGLAALTLSNGTASSAGLILPGGSYNLTAHYQGDATFGSSDSTPGIPVSITAENSKTLISIPTFDPTTGHETGNAPTSIVYGSPYLARIDVGNAQATLSFPSKPICTPQSCPTGTISWTDSLNGAPAAPLDGGTFGLNSEGFTEDQQIQLSGGSHLLSASYSGDNSYKASSSTYALTVTRAPMGFSAQVLGNPIVSGTPFQVRANGAAQTQSGVGPTGTVTIFDGSTQLGSPVPVSGNGGRFPGFSVYPNVTIATGGMHTLSANYSGDSNYAPATVSTGSFLVLWQTTMAITPSATNINYGQSVSLTVSVTTSGKSPAMTGTFNVFGSFTAIPSPVTPTLTTDASGNPMLTATITTTPQFSEYIQVSYSGDANFAGSNANSVFINVNIPDFSLPNTTITVTAGQSQSVTVNVTPASSTPSTVTFSSGTFSLPAGMSLSFNPSTVNLNGAPVPVNITVSTTGPSGGPTAMVMQARNEVRPLKRETWWSGSLISGLVMLLLLGMPGRRRRYLAALFAGTVCLVTLLLGCGGGSSGGVGASGGGGPVPTSISLTTSQSKVPAGSPFTLTATVTSTNALTGTVNIFEGHPPNGQGVVPPIQVVNGKASAVVTNPFGAGTYEYWAQYTGDPNHLPSQTTTSVEEVLTGTTTAVYVGHTGGLSHQAQITINLQ